MKLLKIKYNPNVYRKLNNFSLTHISTDTQAIRKHLQNPKPTHEIESILEADKSDYKIRKTLYIASEMVIDLEIGKTLTRIKENIFRYKDMKIVFLRMQKH